jgi:hypothetical protein
VSRQGGYRVDQFICACEFLEREIAMHRVEELVEARMGLVLHDGEFYRAAKVKR